ncbi:hypothetical protein AGR4A_pAt30103 [Agrobacterium tumefaciens str. B6]|uniref:Uncharacterized protein n=1 Tax=Agrobacterium tumefaciens str. B6 TaxID=1183423 RepID=A0A822VBU8_AGRTU|nr:hypothetical protein AGR4A_pAt30103 [Agrobacterium tumefaciens str. B6]
MGLQSYAPVVFHPSNIGKKNGHYPNGHKVCIWFLFTFNSAEHFSPYQWLQTLATKYRSHPIRQLTLELLQPLGVVEVCDIPDMTQVEWDVLCVLSNKNDLAA